MNDTPILIESAPLTLDQWLRELSRELTKAVAGKETVCITAPLVRTLAKQAEEYAAALVERQASSAPPGE